jgi:hypothetical protein
MSAKCQQETHAPQQKNSYWITSSPERVPGQFREDRHRWRNEGVRELNPFLIDPTGTAHHVAFWTGIAAWHEKTKEQSYDY